MLVRSWLRVSTRSLVAAAAVLFLPWSLPASAQDDNPPGPTPTAGTAVVRTQIRRGNQANLGVLLPGELAYTVDTQRLYVGTPGGTNSLLVQVGGGTDAGVPTTRVIAAGAGLTGGGDLSADRTLGIATGGITGAMIAAGTIGINRLSVTGTASSSTFLRGDGAWGTPSTGITSLGLNLPSLFSVTGSPVTAAQGNGTISVSLALQPAALVFATHPTLNSVSPGFRSLTAEYLPSIPVGKIAATGTPSAATYLRGDGSWETPSGTGSVTSVALSAPASLLTVGGSPVTTSGTLSLSLATQASGTAFMGPVSGSDSAPTWRTIVGSDLPLATTSTRGAVVLAASGGTTADTVVTATDARLSNARTPTAHASSHASGGTDVLTPADIGAVPTARTLTAGTGLTGGGTLAADRTISIATGGVSTSLLADAAVTIAKIGATGTPDAATFLRGDGTWAAASGSGGVTNIATGSGLTGGPITTTGTIGIANLGVTGAMIANGTVTVGKISATGTASSVTYLRGDGAWATPSSFGASSFSGNVSITSGLLSVAAATSSLGQIALASSTNDPPTSNSLFNRNGSLWWADSFGNKVDLSGAIPVSRLSTTGTASASTYLRGDGQWATPSGGGAAEADSVEVFANAPTATLSASSSAPFEFVIPTDASGAAATWNATVTARVRVTPSGGPFVVAWHPSTGGSNAAHTTMSGPGSVASVGAGGYYGTGTVNGLASGTVVRVYALLVNGADGATVRVRLVKQ